MRQGDARLRRDRRLEAPPAVDQARVIAHVNASAEPCVRTSVSTSPPGVACQSSWMPKRSTLCSHASVTGAATRSNTVVDLDVAAHVAHQLAADRKRAGARQSLLVRDRVADAVPTLRRHPSSGSWATKANARRCWWSTTCPMLEAENGREGLEKAQAVLPDVILMDNVMPVMEAWRPRSACARCPR